MQEDQDEVSQMDQPTILIVDDEDEILQKMSLFLSEYNVLTARSAREAIEKIVYHKVDLVVTDIGLPGATGLELATLIDMMADGLPVVVVSANETEASMCERFPQNTCVDFLEKPLSKEKLTESVEMALCMEIKVTA